MERWTPKKGILLCILCVLTAFCLLPSEICLGQGPPRVTIESTAPQKLDLTVGKSVVLQSPDPVKRVSLVTPEIADAMVLTPHQIYLIGKAPGLTTLTLWVDNRVSAVLDLEVVPDLSRLNESFRKMFPGEKDLQLTAAHDGITLSGTVSSTSTLSRVLSLAESYFPKKIVNLLDVAGVHQVMLEVRVAEMSRSLLRRLGFNFNYVSSSGRNFGLSLLNNLTRLPSEGFPTASVEVTDSINAIFRFLSNDTTWTVFIDALKEQGSLKVLAEPTLITLSGRSASFLAGGEFPIPVPQPGAGGTAITIEYKPFGVGLHFTPTVLSTQKISMQVAPEVSELDFSRAVAISGFVVPAVTTRRVSTVIEMADGQSFAIAGLLKDDVREVVSKFPVLGDIPVLGALFRSSSFQKNETELVIIVTPHLVKPLDIAKQTLPTDQFIEPDDFEFYLLGHLEGSNKARAPVPRSPGIPPKKIGLEGNFGHIVPK
jgi:pilus assembly protein CpaC